VGKLHHIGIAVRDLGRARETWALVLGAEAGPPEDVPEEGVRISFLRAGEAKVELLEPLSLESPIAKFLEKRGEGIHHVAFSVPDCKAALEGLIAAGVPTIDKTPRFRGGNRHVAFVHPKGPNGVLVELVQYTSREAEEAGY
jgi:methylmalonyl-CoA/ethylmalonyl-CoA epimerase